MGRPDLVEKYKQKAAAIVGEEFADEEQVFGDAPRQVRILQRHAVYAAMVEAMDQAVGKVLKQLDDSGVADNTIVVFTSDNGGLSSSEGSPPSNLPLRGGKGWVYEGGIREPWIIRYPGVTEPGSVSSQPICSIDLFPTIAAAAGIKVEHPIDGIDIRPALDGGALNRQSLFWHYPHYSNQGGIPGGAIREGESESNRGIHITVNIDRRRSCLSCPDYEQATTGWIAEEQPRPRSAIHGLGAGHVRALVARFAVGLRDQSLHGVCLGEVPRSLHQRVAQDLQPGSVRSRQVDGTGQAGRREIHGLHHQAPQRVLHVGHQDHRFQHHAHAVRQGHRPGLRRRMPAARHESRLLLLARGFRLQLQARCSCPRRQGRRPNPQRPDRVHQAASRRAADQLRRHRRGLPRRRPQGGTDPIRPQDRPELPRYPRRNGHARSSDFRKIPFPGRGKPASRWATNGNTSRRTRTTSRGRS